MHENLKSWNEFTHREVTKEEAKEYFKDNPYKLELIDEIVEKVKNYFLYLRKFY